MVDSAAFLLVFPAPDRGDGFHRQAADATPQLRVLASRSEIYRQDVLPAYLNTDHDDSRFYRPESSDPALEPEHQSLATTTALHWTRPSHNLYPPLARQYAT